MIFVITLGIFILVITAMAVGVIFGKREIKGSCGGLGGCELCDSDGENKSNSLPPCKEQEQIT